MVRYKFVNGTRRSLVCPLSEQERKLEQPELGNPSLLQLLAFATTFVDG